MLTSSPFSPVCVSQIRPLNVEGTLNLLSCEPARLLYFSNASSGQDTPTTTTTLVPPPFF